MHVCMHMQLRWRINTIDTLPQVLGFSTAMSLVTVDSKPNSSHSRYCRHMCLETNVSGQILHSVPYDGLVCVGVKYTAYYDILFA